MKKLVKILKPVQSYEVGKVYRLQGSFMNSLVKRGKAEEVIPEKKEEKKVIETKEEKFTEKTIETKDFSAISITKLKDAVKDYTLEDLADLLKDKRISAIKLAQEEIKKRGN